MKLSVDKEKCTGCGACINSCPFGAIEMKDGVAVINDQCRGCGACLASCRRDAIK